MAEGSDGLGSARWICHGKRFCESKKNVPIPLRFFYSLLRWLLLSGKAGDFVQNINKPTFDALKRSGDIRNHGGKRIAVCHV